MIHLLFIIALVGLVVGAYRVGDGIDKPYNYSTFQFFISYTMVMFSGLYVVAYIDYMFIQ